MKQKQNKYVFAAILSGCLWGTVGMFSRLLQAGGMSLKEINLIRFWLVSLEFFITILVKDPKLLKIRLRDIWIFLLCGVGGLFIFSVLYFRSAELIALGATSVFINTCPFFVLVFSYFLFREPLTKRKVAALLVAFAGCVLVSGMGSDTRLVPLGVLFGVGGGFFYAFYTIFNRLALRRNYTAETIGFYSWTFAALAAMLLWHNEHPVAAMFLSVENVIYCLLLGIVVAYAATYLYSYSLTGIETGRAAILTNSNPIMATLLGIFVFGERLSLLQFLGIVLTLGAVVLINTDTPKAIISNRSNS